MMPTMDPQTLSLAARLNPHRETQEILARITWSVLTEPGDALGGALRDTLGAPDALEVALSDTVVPDVGAALLREARARWRPRAEPALVRAAVRSAVRLGLRLVVPGDAEWPRRLDDLGVHAPAALWLRGASDTLVRNADAVSVVGARAATAYGEHMAREISADLAAADVLIVSGGAYGIDGAAHRAALGVGGDTVAFLAGGLDRAYPSGHARLFDRIAERSAVVSEVPCGAAPTKWRFLARNRLIGALGAATVVVEAGARSGTLNTAGHAAQLGRPLGAVPGPVTSAASAGCHRLLREYDAFCVTSADDVRELLGMDVATSAVSRGATTDDAVRVLDALSTRTARGAEDIARRSGMSTDDVRSLLGYLHLEGRVVRGPEGWRILPGS